MGELLVCSSAQVAVWSRSTMGMKQNSLLAARFITHAIFTPFPRVKLGPCPLDIVPASRRGRDAPVTVGTAHYHRSQPLDSRRNSGDNDRPGKVGLPMLTCGRRLIS